jgi:hypothetical protein
MANSIVLACGVECVAIMAWFYRAALPAAREA